MTTIHSYRVDGSLDMRLPNGDPDKHVTARGDYVSPDRLELDVEGLRPRTAEQVIIVGENAYQRERYRPGVRGRSDWVQLRSDSLDTVLTGGVPELTLHIEEFLSGIDWTSLEEVDGGAVLKGSVSSNGIDVVTSYRMSVRDYESVPDATRKRWIYTLDAQTIDRSGPERALLQQASYEFSLYFFHLDVREPRVE